MSLKPSYPNPLAGFENEPALPDTFNADGKSLFNGPPSDKLSASYETFPEPIDPSNNGFDFHSMPKSLSFLSRSLHDNRCGLHLVYYMQAVEAQKEFAKALHERIRREFPEVSISFVYTNGFSKSYFLTI